MPSSTPREAPGYAPHYSRVDSTALKAVKSPLELLPATKEKKKAS